MFLLCLRLEDSYSSVRAGAAIALGELGCKEALKSLKEALGKEESIITIRELKKSIEKLEIL